MPEYFKPVSPELEKKHRALWSPLYSPVDLSFLRFACNFSSIHDHRYVPQDVYTAIIMRIMNDIDRSIADKDKNYLDQYIDPENAPKTFLRNIGGDYVNQSFQIICRQVAKQIFQNLGENIIVKPSLASARGQNVRIFQYDGTNFLDNSKNPVGLEYLEKKYIRDFVIQEQVKQHPSLSKLNKSSVNSFRICTYRSVKTEEVHILKSFLKIGRPGNVIDNIYGGGLICHVDKKGYLHDYAINIKREKLFTVPNLNIPFKGMSIPHFDRIIELSKIAGRSIPAHRLLCLDVALTEKNRASVLEINLINSGIPQILGGPHFDEFTDEIVEYCRQHRGKDNFRIFRS